MTDFIPVYMSDISSDLLVYVYIRDNAPNMDIPIDVIDLCFLWYFDKSDRWDVTKMLTDKFEHDPTTNTIKCTGYARGGDAYFTIVGCIIISKSLSEREWKIKCVQYELDQYNFFFVVGLVPTTYDHTDSDEALFDYGYGFDTFNGSLRPLKHAKQFGPDQRTMPEEGDIFSVKYKTIKDSTGIFHGEMRFAINGKELEAYHGKIAIHKGETYRFGVSFYGSGETIQLLQ